MSVSTIQMVFLVVAFGINVGIIFALFILWLAARKKVREYEREIVKSL